MSLRIKCIWRDSPEKQEDFSYFCEQEDFSYFCKYFKYNDKKTNRRAVKKDNTPFFTCSLAGLLSLTAMSTSL